MKRVTLLSLKVLSVVAILTNAATAETSTIRAAKQYGLGYLQLMIMEDQKLVEKHANALGVADIKVEWSTFRSSDVMNDALISGNVDFVSLGLPGLITIWSKTRNNYDVRVAAGLNAIPWFLNSRLPEIKTLKDFNESHRIAVPAVKVSMQALLLQIAAAKEWGVSQYQRLDPLTVSLSHPDATAMLIGGKSEIVANFSSAPFQYRQLKDPGIHRVISSDEILGGSASFNVIATTAKYRRDNPKLYKAFLGALQEATALINQDKQRAISIYKTMSKDKSSDAEILGIMNDPQTRFTTDVSDLGVFTEFMSKVGTLKNPPKDWKAEMLFPEAVTTKN